MYTDASLDVHRCRDTRAFVVTRCVMSKGTQIVCPACKGIEQIYEDGNPKARHQQRNMEVFVCTSRQGERRYDVDNSVFIFCNIAHRTDRGVSSDVMHTPMLDCLWIRLVKAEQQGEVDTFISGANFSQKP